MTFFSYSVTVFSYY